MSLGMRVLRGPDWDQSEADGGEGHLGTVVGVKAEEGTAEVVWDNGQVTTCRVGKEGKHDLRILDNAQTGVKHLHVTCDACRKSPLLGIRWKCAECDDFDLCTPCYVMGRHDPTHPFDRVDRQAGERVPVGRRSGARRVPLVGIFPGARVTRGRDWLAANADDGAGGVGTVVEVVSPESGSARNAVRVSWDSGQSLQHRLGLHGKVDLVLSKESPAAPPVYIDHLPVLETERMVCGLDGQKIEVGDTVKVDVEEDNFLLLQKRSCGWSVGMKKCVQKTGHVKAITMKGYVDVNFGEFQWRICSKALKKVREAPATFSMGDTVRILEDKERVKQLQDGHGGWIDAMESCLGKVGRIKLVHPGGNLTVEFGLPEWCFNRLCCKPAPGCAMECVGFQVSAQDLMEQFSQMTRLLGAALPSQLRERLQVSTTAGTQTADAQSKLVKAILTGDVSRVAAMLDRSPELINCRVNNETPLHFAAENGETEVAIFLLDRGAELDCLDNEDDTPLMLAVRKGHLRTVKMFLERGANVNLANENGRTCLHKAATRGHLDLIRLLLDHGASVNKRDVDGDTPLFDVINKGDRDDLLEVLMTSPDVDLRTPNRKNFNLLHFASLRGRPRSAAAILARDRSLVNVCKESDQYCAAHIAATNDHTDVLKVLMQCGADLEKQCNDGTPLHLSCEEVYIDTTMMLVEAGVDLNSVSARRDTPMHRVLCNVGDLARNTKVAEEARLQLANFLLQHGARIDFRNQRGLTALEQASDSLRKRVEAFMRENGLPKTKETAEMSDPRSPVSGNVSQTPQVPSAAPPAVTSKCVTCSAREADVIFLPCAHKLVCRNCASVATSCPQCKKPINVKIDTDGKPLVG